jgi:hypothetical protein
VSTRIPASVDFEKCIDPGHYGDWTAVMQVIVTDRGDVREFRTLDGVFIGAYHSLPIANRLRTENNTHAS